MSTHRPRKRFGQHFLHDAGVIERIVSSIAPRPGQCIVEIGPGEGVLTGPVLERAGALTVIELDRDLAAALPQRLGHPQGLRVIQDDALTVDFSALATDGPIRVIGNLPYNISTPLLFHLFAHAPVITDMHFMLQKEVVDRLVATPGSRQFGRLSVMAGFHCDMSHLFDVPPDAFRPPPKVDSAVIRMQPRTLSALEQVLLPALAQVTRQAYNQRRKTLRNSLKGLLNEEAIKACEIDPSARPETLSLEAFKRLADRLSAAQT